MAKKITSCLLLILILISNKNFAQEETESAKRLPSIAVGVGVLTFNGDVGGGINISSFGRVRTGYNITVEQRIKNIIGISFNSTFGKIADSDHGKIGGFNFESKITQVDLNLILHIDNGFLLKENSPFAPYLSAGIGFLKFDPRGDLADQYGNYYNYWSDGTIRDLPESDPLAATANHIAKDYNYETTLKDSATNYKRSSLAIPIGGGVAFNLSSNWALNVGGVYYFTLTDWMDNIKGGKNDQYLYAQASLKYTFAKKKSDNSAPQYKSVDFAKVDNTDMDKDGVLDKDDMCPSTPSGVKVDSKGCPFDKDGDGVPDYKDKENTTAKGALVDENGVTISEQMLSEQQLLWDSMATERSELFNQNPSLKYLQEVETKKSESKGTSNNKIPTKLKPADSDKDGIISSSEITAAIDSFFEGDSPFTVEILNDLIDYFFEQ